MRADSMRALRRCGSGKEMVYGKKKPTGLAVGFLVSRLRENYFFLRAPTFLVAFFLVAFLAAFFFLAILSPPRMSSVSLL